MELGHPSHAAARAECAEADRRSQASRERFRCYMGQAVGSLDKALRELPALPPAPAAPAALRRPMTDRERQQFRAIELVTDASALLWKLDLLGVDVGARWQVVADQWEAAGPLGDYAYEAWIAMMAFVGAGRQQSQRDTLLTLKVISLGWGDAAYFAKECGMAAAQGILAFGAGRYAETVDLLRPLRSCAHRFRGHGAQRDLMALTLFEAALRSGQDELASSLVDERIGRANRALPRRRAAIAPAAVQPAGDVVLI